MKLFIQLFCALVVPVTSFAGAQNFVYLTGLVYDNPSTHTTTHGHSLNFKEAESMKSYGIVDSPEIERLHHETNKNFTVRVEGRITPKFLFFGGNLVVTKFEVLAESEVIALNASPVPSNFRVSEKR